MAAVLLLMTGLIGCSDEYDTGYLGGAPIFVEPLYIGEEVTTVDRVFTKEDFSVIVNYDDGSHKVVEDYEITECTLLGGVYTIIVEWRGLEGDAMIVLDKNLFMETEAAETEAPETAEETTAAEETEGE